MRSFHVFLASVCVLSLACLTPLAAADDPYYTAFHAQPFKNWLNDPNGPMYFNGKYHLFFQYNPGSYHWGDMHWYHMVSEDLVHWKHLPIALAPDEGYDCGGIFSGSVTVVYGVPVISYSVACGTVIVQAVPADLTDPDLVVWNKTGVAYKKPAEVGGFRDPTTAWMGEDGFWRQVVGSNTGSAEFKSANFKNWTYVGTLSPSSDSQEWECPDFYVVPGTDTFVTKASDGGDWWATGKYTEVSDPTKPDEFKLVSPDIRQNNQKYDMGSFYASKSFYDPVKQRQILFGWVNYHCDTTNWAGVQTFPRKITLDPVDPTWLNTYPIDEIDSLHTNHSHMGSQTLVAGQSVDVAGASGNQQDILAVFLIPAKEASFGLRVQGSVDLLIAVNATGSVSLDGHSIFLGADETTVSLRVLVDHSIVEVYLQGGRLVMTKPSCVTTTGTQLVNQAGSDVTLISLDYSDMSTANVMPN